LEIEDMQYAPSDVFAVAPEAIDGAVLSKIYALAPDRIWNGVSDKPEAGQAVIVDDQTIEAICPVGQVPDSIPILKSGPNRTLLPGLIDAHVHYSPWMGPAFLAAGVTTVRDTGNDLEWILEQKARNEQDITAGPTILCCGYALDGPVPYWKYIGRSHPDTETLRQTIRQQAQRKIWGIKFYDGLSPELMAAGVDEARRHNLPVICDLGTDEPRAIPAVRAGVKEIEHLSGCPAAWHESTLTERDQLIDCFLRSQVTLMPTLAVWDHLGRVLDVVFKYDSRRKWVHPQYLRIWDNYPSRSAVPDRRLRFQRPICHMKQFLNHAFQRRVAIGLGTDTPFPNVIPGFSVHDELAMYVDAGLSPIDALRVATSTNARILGLDSRLGQIKPGMQADMLLVSGNPFAQISDIGNVEFVVRKGLPLDLAELMKVSSKCHLHIVDDPITRDLYNYLDASSKEIS
jgi:imidazolonepropionase-like amidohydrolase